MFTKQHVLHYNASICGICNNWLIVIDVKKGHISSQQRNESTCIYLIAFVVVNTATMEEIQQTIFYICISFFIAYNIFSVPE